MTLYAVALILPDQIEQILDNLRGDYNRYMNYIDIPHLTLVYPFVPEVDITIVNEKLEEVAKRTKPFTLVLNGIEYFEGDNNVAYAAIENKRPVIDLHTDIIHSLNGLIKEEYTNGQFNVDRFVPHVTIGEHIPDVVFLTVKKTFADYQLHYEIEIVSFPLFSLGEDSIWKTTRLFEITGK